MKTILWTGIVLFNLSFCDSPPKKSEKKEEPITQQMKQQWENLFDGSDTDAWHLYNGDGEMSQDWYIEGENLVFRPVKGHSPQNIVTQAEYTNFELSLEWKISEAGNSGIFYGVIESDKYIEPYLTGPEIQVLDNERHEDAFIKPKYHQAGALYDMIQPRSEACKPAGEWNHLFLQVNHQTNKASVKLNGIEIVTYEPHGENWDALVRESKFKNLEAYNYVEAPDFGKFKTGKIGLQDHGNIVSYRNIKIREIQ